MSDFFDKLKQGVSEVGNKAKVLVDVNRVKLQIAQEEREIRSEFEKIGEVVFAAHQRGDFSEIGEMVREYCGAIEGLMQEIDELEAKLQALQNEKECPNCKQVMAKDTRFCPACGHKFDE